MGVCRYFLQGNCRFGNNCRFEHPLPSYNASISQANQQQPQLSRQQIQGQLSSNDFCELVRHDLETAEKSGQWLLSCYCPFPSKSAALPGLDDFSPEEMRFLVYQAQATGNSGPCVQQIQKLYQDAQARRNIFKSQTPDCKELLERVRSGPASPVASSGANANPFLGGNSSNSGGASIFGGGSSAQPPGIFGGSALPQASPSVFGGGSAGGAAVAAHSNPFRSGNPQASSMFGGGSGTPTPTPTVNPFMGGSGSGAQPQGQPPPYGAPSFGASPYNTSAFGGSAFGGSPVPAGGSAFGGSPVPARQGSVFGGGAPSVFGGQPLGGAPLGGAPLGGQPNSMFQGAAPEGATAGGSAPTINSFSFAAAAMGSQQLQGLVAAPGPAAAGTQQPFATNPSSALQPPAGGVTVAAAAGAPAGNPFMTRATATVPSTSGALSQPLPDSGVHLPPNELTEQEKAEFMAPTFSKGRIPLRPPPLQLCT